MITVLSFDPEWPRSFEQEASRIRAALEVIAVEIHHIGSTAIPQTKAKPVIDILLEVTSLGSLDNKSTLMESLGYEAKGEFGIPGRRYFQLEDSAGRRTHQVHAFEEGCRHVIRHIAFRDYMRVHPLIAAEYGELKARLASENPHDMEAYVNGKDAFVKEHEERALLWAGGHG